MPTPAQIMTAPTKAQHPTVGEAIVQLLTDYGIDLVFGIPGTHSIELYRGLSAGNIRHVNPRHEQGGGFMADGYARMCGKPAACFVITGPGVTNLTTPLGEAFLDSVPMLIISPVNPPDARGYNHARLHEITDQSGVTKPLTAFTVTVESADEIPALIARAFEIFAASRPAPVHINIPLPIIGAQVDNSGANWQAQKSLAPPQAEREKITEAVSLLHNAKSPVIVAGGGARNAAAEVVALAEEIPAPLITSVAGRGVISGEHPLSAGAQLRARGVQELIAESDVGVFIGTDFAQPDHWNEALQMPPTQIWINRDRALLERMKEDADGEVTVIYADAANAAREILESICAERKAAQTNTRESNFPAAKARCDRARESHPKELTEMQKKHLAALQPVMENLPSNAFVVSDMTQIAYTACDFLPLAQPGKWFHPTGYGTLGYALPAAIGALLAAPQRAALVLVGDAGFQYTMQEMTTAAELELNLVVLLWNNDALQQILGDMLEADFPPLAVHQRNPDFIALAKSCGWRAQKIKSANDIGAAIRDAFAGGGQVLLQLDQNLMPKQD